MIKFISLYRLAFVAILILYHKVAHSSSSSSSSSHYANFSSSYARRCSHEESSALLQFKRTFTMTSYSSFHCDYPKVSNSLRSFPKTKYWKEGSDCCSWDGVKCDEVSDHVIKLDLACSQLQGIIYSNSSLFQLSHLQSLNLAFNNFTGSEVSSSFGQFANLSHLNLSSSFFSGFIASEISNLSRLVSLDLSIDDPFLQHQNLILENFDLLLHNLTRLEEVVLDGIYVSFSMASKSYLGRNMSAASPSSYSLTYLSLRGCDLQRFQNHDIFSYLQSLEYLDLSSNQFAGGLPKGIGNLTKLTHLDISSYGLTGQISSTIFSKLVQLEFLDLSGNYFKGQIPNSFASLKKLEVLRLNSNGFTGGFPSSLANLSQLNYLSISDNHLTGHIPSWLFRRPSLVTLNLEHNQLTGEIPPHIGKLLNLSQLILSFNLIGGMIPPSLFNLPSLETLQLNDNLISGPIPSNITGLQKLHGLYLSNNALNCSIPSALLALPSLTHLDVSNNMLTGQLGQFQSNVLQDIDLSNNALQGANFNSISNLVNLTRLNLESNNLTGTLELDVLSGIQKLQSLDLSNNSHLTLNSSDKVSSPLPEFVGFQMSGCNVSAFPFFLRNLVQLRMLDLSNNKIHGPLPTWLGNMGKTSLTFLNLSRNFLTSSVEILPWANITHLDLSFNLLEGQLPLPPTTVVLYFISNNKLRGTIHPRICDLSKLWLVNFSNNSLSGNLPNCLLNKTGLSVLNLRRNNLSGTIPAMHGLYLKTLDLSHNQLEGQIPRSLANCISLEILDLGYNRISDTFPNWLGIMPKLKILVLRANRLYGSIAKPRYVAAFDKLSVIDLSYNNLSGNLPSYYFFTWKSMMTTGGYNGRANSFNDVYYLDSVSLTNKGQERELVQITLSIIKAIDFSNNKFEGNIPGSIGNLNSLVVLNLSSNCLTGDIPLSMGDLVQLESLDLSNNKLSRRIPEQLSKLTFLGAFNVSQNKLEGQIPQTGQLSRFSYDSYEGNPGLCGIPLPKKCEKEVPPPRLPSPSSEQERNSDTMLDGFNWKSVATGYGCGAVVGIVIGYIIIKRKEEWVLSIFNIRLIWQMKISSIVTRE